MLMVVLSCVYDRPFDRPHCPLARHCANLIGGAFLRDLYTPRCGVEMALLKSSSPLNEVMAIILRCGLLLFPAI